MTQPPTAAPYCEIIGCHSRAQWRVTGLRGGETVEQYLCHPHWRQAMADPALTVVRWSRAVPEELSGGEGEADAAA